MPRLLPPVAALAILPFAAGLPAKLQYRHEPVVFESWDDVAQAEPAESNAATCPGGGVGCDGGEGCGHWGKPDTNVDDKIQGVRDYYNSPRVNKLIANPTTLPLRAFHSPFHVRRLNEGQYMMLLAGLRSPAPPHGVLKRDPAVVVLDYGCGLGEFARSIAKTGCCEVHCVNIAEEQVKAAVELTENDAVTFQAYDGQRFPYEDAFFDVVFFQESFSFHTPNQCAIAAEFSRVLRPEGRLVGLDWMSAIGLDDAEYAYWIAPINRAWEASTGTPEHLARCFRQAHFERVEFIDTAHLGGIPEAERPRNQFLGVLGAQDEHRYDMLAKYPTLGAQLDIASFTDKHRHTYALEAMSLAIENRMYLEAFIVAYKEKDHH